MKTDKKIEEIRLIPTVSSGMWSYITNQNGNSMRITLEGYGSCTPESALQEMIDNLTYEQKAKLSKQIDESRDSYD